MLFLDFFGFRALWSPFFLLALIGIVIGYFLITVKYQKLFKNSEPLEKKTAIYFMVSIILLYVIKGSPLDLMGHLMFSAHMFQMAFLYLVIPPLLIKGIPNWIWKNILDIKPINKLFRFFTHPIISLILFNGIFSFYHVPLIFDFVKTDMWLHASYTNVLFLLALFMWWPLVNTLSQYQTLSGIKKVGYIFANGILITPACALIIFADTPLYATYSDPSLWAEALSLCVPAATLSTLTITGPEMFNTLPLIDDQQLGGVVMKILQEIFYGVILAKVFFKWYQDEQKIDEPDQVESGIYQPNLIKS